MKALIAFVLMLILVYFVAEIADEPVLPTSDTFIDSPNVSGQAGTQKIDLLSFECPKTAKQYSANIRFRNSTGSVLESVSAVVLFNPKGRMPFEDSVAFTPATIRPSGVAEAIWSGPERNGRDFECTLLRIEDIDGNRLAQ